MEGILQNLDLFSVGIAISATGILGFIVFLSNQRSITNKTFLAFSIITIIWGIANYLHYQATDPTIALWLLRFVLFSAAWQSFTIFQLFYVFPSDHVLFPRKYKLYLVPTVFIAAFITLTPLVFSKIIGFSAEGVPEPIVGPGIIVFGIISVGLVIGSFYTLLKKMRHTNGVEHTQLRLILTGTLLMFALIIPLNFILPNGFKNFRFLPLSAIFSFPFAAFSAYAILKHHLLGVKVIATETLTFILSIAVLYEVIFAETLAIRILRVGIFLLVFAFGILLIRSVRKEVEQRERLQKLTEDLNATNKKLTELDELKSEFLSFAAHQVKSPMNNVKGFADLIYQGAYGAVSDEAKEKAKRIKENADRTLAVVSNLLDLGKIESGKMEYQFKEVDIVGILKSMVEDYQVTAKGKGLDLQFESAAPSLSIRADEEKIRQVLQNVIDNSIKYTKVGFVKVKIEERGDYVLISVVDSGQGMSLDLQKKLFGRFVRDEKTKNEIQGTGLGLYLAKQFVTNHNGKIWAESDGEGKGSRFFVQLSKH